MPNSTVGSGRETCGASPALASALARGGAIVFAYDMVGWGETRQVPHSSTRALALQLWNSMRVIDFFETLPEVDRSRIAIIGASAGGTQAIGQSADSEQDAAAASKAEQTGAKNTNISVRVLSPGDDGDVFRGAGMVNPPWAVTVPDDFAAKRRRVDGRDHAGRDCYHRCAGGRENVDAFMTPCTGIAVIAPGDPLEARAATRAATATATSTSRPTARTRR